MCSVECGDHTLDYAVASQHVQDQVTVEATAIVSVISPASNEYSEPLIQYVCHPYPALPSYYWYLNIPDVSVHVRSTAT
jgi:hypothetical protein